MKLIAHPFDDYRLGDFLLSGLESDAIGFAGAAAFARRSGVGYLAAALHSFSRTRPFQLTIGVDLLGTSKEALELLLQSASDEARIFVFHNPNATFHPKHFRFEYDDRWEIYAGSGNLTAGGMFNNYELGLVAKLSKELKEDTALNRRFDAEFARWSDVASGTVKQLSEAIIKQLADHKLVVNEKVIGATRAAARIAAGEPSTKKPLFTPSPVPSAPALPTAIEAAPAKPAVNAGTTSLYTAPAVAYPRTFVITVRQTDVGVGQTTPGTQKRAAEIFIPLRCVWEHPEFWGWPQLFEADLNWQGVVKQGYGKMDRRQMPFFVDSHAEWVTMTYNPDKGDFRLRNSTLRDAGAVDDILRISIAGTAKTPIYVADFVRTGTAEHSAELARCNQAVKPPSTKRYGYY